MLHLIVAAIDFQSLDRVSAYTAERANEPLSARLGSFRAARVESCLRDSLSGKWAMKKISCLGDLGAYTTHVKWGLVHKPLWSLIKEPVYGK